MKVGISILAIILAMPCLALADRWDRGGGRDNRGYNYDRGARYQSGSSYRYGGYRYGGYSCGPSYGYGYGYGYPSYYGGSGFGISFGYSSGYRYGDRYGIGFSYSSGGYRPPAPVYREVYVTPRYYDCPPPVVYYPSTYRYSTSYYYCR